MQSVFKSEQAIRKDLFIKARFPTLACELLKCFAFRGYPPRSLKVKTSCKARLFLAFCFLFLGCLFMLRASFSFFFANRACLASFNGIASLSLCLLFRESRQQCLC